MVHELCFVHIVHRVGVYVFDHNRSTTACDYGRMISAQLRACFMAQLHTAIDMHLNSFKGQKPRRMVSNLSSFIVLTLCGIVRDAAGYVAGLTSFRGNPH
jgi:hypothetical protein